MGELRDLLIVFGLISFGLWLIWKNIFREGWQGKAQVDLDVRVLGRQGSQVLVELVSRFENKGDLMIQLRQLDFNLSRLNKDSTIQAGGEEINYQVQFDKLTEGKGYPTRWEDTYIPSGTSKEYVYLAAIPQETTYLLYDVTFKLGGGNIRTQQRAFPIREID